MNTIITLEQLKKYMEVTEGNETLLTSLLGVATTGINEYLGYDLEYQERKELFRDDIHNPIYVKYRPLREVLSVSLNDKEQKLFNHTERYIELDECINYTSCYCTGSKCYKFELKYNAGLKYGTDDIPENLIYLISLWILDLIEDMGKKRNVTSYKINDISYTYDKTKSNKENVFKFFRWFV